MYSSFGQISPKLADRYKQKIKGNPEIEERYTFMLKNYVIGSGHPNQEDTSLLSDRANQWINGKEDEE